MRDLSKLLRREHENTWVAFSRDYRKIVDFDSNVLSLKERVHGQKIIYRKIPPADVYLSC